MKAMTKKFETLSAFGSLFLALTLLCGGTASATTIYINTSGWWIDATQFNTSSTPIQSGINNATADDMVIVSDGIYNENVIVNTRLTIRSENGSANCIVNALNSNTHVFDIQIDHVALTGLTIMNATTYGAGIYLGSGANDCTISGNNCTGNHYGIYLAYANNNTITDNKADLNGWFGIYLYYSANNRVINNSASFTQEYLGIYALESDNTTLVNNTANYNNWEGIRLQYSDNCTVIKNNLSSNNFTDLGTGLLVWTSRNGVIRNNTVYDNDYGIYLHVESHNNTIIDNIASYHEVHGIVVYQSSDVTVYHNTANHSGYHGIFVYDIPTNNITIRNNMASHNYYNGIFAASGPSNLTIIGNILRDNGAGDDIGYGIYMGRGSEAIIADNYIADNAAPNHAYGMKVFSFTNATIHHNTIVNNNDYGILLDNLSGSGTSESFGSTSTRGAATVHTEARGDTAPPDVPARLEEEYFYPDYGYSAPRSLSSMLEIRNTPSSVNITENWITNNIGGISLNSSDNITIAGNTITDNGIGINLTSSNDNLIYNNYFQNTNNAYDDGMNKWNITKTPGTNIIGGSWVAGNYWHEYTGPDTDADGLGETPYNIAGGTNKDYSPLVQTVPPDLVITHQWVNWPTNCTVCYNVTNIGNGRASAGHNTTLQVDGIEVALDLVSADLEPGESYIGCFQGYTWTYTPPGNTITVCADCNNTAAEANETNNCRTQLLKCGDVTMDGNVDFLGDVIGVARYYMYGDPIASQWAGDINCDGAIDFLGDAITLARHYMYGDPLTCCCEKG